MVLARSNGSLAFKLRKGYRKDLCWKAFEFRLT